MADETKPVDPKTADPTPPKKAGPKKPPTPHDTTIPGGAFIQGGWPGDDDKHYGGRVVNCDGNALAEFADDEVNDGKPADKDAAPGARPRTLEEMNRDKKAAAPAPKK